VKLIGTPCLAPMVRTANPILRFGERHCRSRTADPRGRQRGTRSECGRRRHRDTRPAGGRRHRGTGRDTSPESRTRRPIRHRRGDTGGGREGHRRRPASRRDDGREPHERTAGPRYRLRGPRYERVRSRPSTAVGESVPSARTDALLPLARLGDDDRRQGLTRKKLRRGRAPRRRPRPRVRVRR
jgi:hypothetical protein